MFFFYKSIHYFRTITLNKFKIIYIYRNTVMQNLVNNILRVYYNLMINSIRFGYDDLQWLRIRLLLRSAAYILVLPDPAWCESRLADDLHFYADVLHFHEFQGKHCCSGGRGPLYPCTLVAY